MPVTIFPAPHSAKQVITSHRNIPTTALGLLSEACPEEHRECLELLQSSLGKKELLPKLIPASNGFVNSAITAYSHHHHLKIRPDDVWLAIITQFSFFVNKHAEELRASFVAHEGKRKLKIVYAGGDRYTVDFAGFAAQMGSLIQENVIDPELRHWLVPDFSTTKPHDVVVASIVMMGSMQAYFKYECEILCGLPSVTLDGEKADYEKILQRLDKLCNYGDEPTEFASKLRPILKRFVRSFDLPKDAETLSFWNRIYSVYDMGSGPMYYSGWITAFCFWSEDGRRVESREPHEIPDERLDLDGRTYDWIEDDDVPPGYLKVPVCINDNGDEFDALMVAGSVAIKCSSSSAKDSADVAELDSVEPLSAWWIFQRTEI